MGRQREATWRTPWRRSRGLPGAEWEQEVKEDVVRQAAAQQTAQANRVNWLKGEVPVRAYLAQRDHFLELYRCGGTAAGRGERPADEGSREDDVR